MSDTHVNTQLVTLRRARRGADLWPAIEAAQYAHVVQRGSAGEESAAERGFTENFIEIVEAWEAASGDEQAALILRLDRLVDALHEAGRTTHCGTVEQQVLTEDGETVEMPIAIVRLGEDSEETVAVTLHFDAALDDGEPV